MRWEIFIATSNPIYINRYFTLSFEILFIKSKAFFMISPTTKKSESRYYFIDVLANSERDGVSSHNSLIPSLSKNFSTFSQCLSFKLISPALITFKIGKISPRGEVKCLIIYPFPLIVRWLAIPSVIHLIIFLFWSLPSSDFILFLTIRSASTLNSGFSSEEYFFFIVSKRDLKIYSSRIFDWKTNFRFFSVSAKVYLKREKDVYSVLL